MTPDPETEPTVLLSVADGVAVVRLNRPDRGNAITTPMGAAYVETLARVEADADVRAIVVTGSGKAFCTGADIGAVQGLADGRGPGGGSRMEAGLDESYLRPLRIPKPVVAAVNGACAGVGLAIAAACDLRFAAEDATITSSFARLGLVAEFGLSWLLPRIIGTSAALDVLLSGRRLTGAQARALGLVDLALPRDDVLPRAVEYARDLAANCSPRSMATMKSQVYGDLERGIAESYERAAALMKESLAHPDLAEGVRAFRERRRPGFLPLPPAASG